MARLTVNQAIQVTLFGEGSRDPISAVVTEVTEGGATLSFATAESVAKSLPAYLKAGAKLELIFHDDRARCRAATVVKRLVSAPHLMAEIDAPTEFLGKQDRDFFRVKTRLKVSFAVVPTAAPAAASSSVVPAAAISSSVPAPTRILEDNDAVSQDISASGLRLLTMVLLKPLDQLHLMVSVPLRGGVQQLTATGSVVRVVPTEVRRKALYSVAVMFNYSNERERDALVRLMFELQRRQIVDR